MNTNKLTVAKWLLVTAIGIIGFTLLFRYVAIQTNLVATKITLAPAWLTGLTALLGPIGGGVIAFIGHAISDGFSGSVWWTWAIADGLYGVLLGLTTSRLALANGRLTPQKLRIFNFWQMIANVIVWLIVAPLGDMWVYGERAALVFAQGLETAIANTLVTAVFGTAFLVALNKWVAKRN